MLTVIFCE